MTQNTAVNDPFAALTTQEAGPPEPVPPLPAAADAPSLFAMTQDQLQSEILLRIARAERRTVEEIAAEPKHEDGTVAIDSMTAVSVLASFGASVGEEKFVDLAEVDPDDLRSVAGLARLARATLDTMPAVLL